MSDIVLSIVTIIRNDISGLSRTKASLDSIPDWAEWVIVDGDSHDGTSEFAKSCDAIVLSEPDKGIADAFNKGIALSHGKFILFLNGGDELMKELSDDFKCYINSFTEDKIISFSVNFGGRVIGKAVTFSDQVRRNYLPHQGMLIGRSNFDRFGLYNLSFRLGMDYEWSLRLRDFWDDIMIFNTETIVYMEPNGLSVSNYKETFRKYHEARMLNKACSCLMSKFFELFYVSRRRFSIFTRNILSFRK